MELAFLYSTGAGDVSRVREPGYALALCRAYNDYVHDHWAKVSDRLKPVALFPQQDHSRSRQKFAAPSKNWVASALQQRRWDCSSHWVTASTIRSIKRPRISAV